MGDVNVLTDIFFPKGMLAGNGHMSTTKFLFFRTRNAPRPCVMLIFARLPVTSFTVRRADRLKPSP